MTASFARAYNVHVNFCDPTKTVRSYAKINLTLDILEKRPDGFHGIESVMQSISLHDIITLRTSSEPGIRITCDIPGIPTDEKNLAHKAASIFLQRRGFATGLDIHIEKRIPMQAGLGGGSSNAAAVLMGLNQLFGLSVSLDELSSIGAKIGSDVPFFLVGGTALVRGRGEVIQPLPDIPSWQLVIVKPPFGVSTAWAYKRLDEMSSAVGEPTPHSKRMVDCILCDGCLPDALWNDLESPAVERHPEIAEIKGELLRAGASGALMCGSGSAVFGLFKIEEEARTGADRLTGRFGELFVERTLSREEACGGLNLL